MAKELDFLADLGGSENVIEVEPCITRLRVEVVDPELVNDAALKSHGAFGVVRTGRVVQVVVGPEADSLAALLNNAR
ncbi:glucose PTS transporter subunit EIIB [Serinibacter salmoneus]|uniref:PTS system N-acetylglucosamine-specific IIB component (Glc family) n=1 Tax=Serinibacter salmoneus TaxID=556530 RepID=A0A2A9CZT5_9MICO|nr:PTS glucose/sucrose transporter subunit IIB [Serinibacter salmoneus]PFG19947.1 PTS system N-acetylglucosamine-specific IIB component (Glc family) [Serinibacter salmoneus]